MRSKCIVTFFGMLVLQGCAFKESAADKARDAASSLDGRMLGASLSWDGLDKPLALDGNSFTVQGNTWSRANVISIPVIPPQKLIFNTNVAFAPQDVNNWSVKASATTGDDLKVRDLGAVVLGSTPADLGTELSIQLTGVDTLFKVDQEQRMYLTLRVADSSGDETSIRLVVSTPPSRISITEDAALFAHAMDESLNGITSLVSQAEQRQLVWTKTLRNDSFERVEFDFPFKNHGSVYVRGTSYSIQQGSSYGATIYGQQSSAENYDQDTDLYFFPLTANLSEAWTGYSENNLSSISLKPGESIQLGLYVNQDVIAAFNELPASQASSQILPSGASQSCSAPIYGHEPGCHGNCMVDMAIPDNCTTNVSNGTFESGVQTQPVTVNWKDGTLNYIVRFLPDGDSNVAEARTLPLAASGITIRQ